jgi:hypothetical protein
LPLHRVADYPGPVTGPHFSAEEEVFFLTWDGPALTRRAMKCLMAGDITTMAQLDAAIQANRLKWLPGCGHLTELELVKAAGRGKR